MYKAEILADSVSPTGDRLTTMKITFPRIVLAEFNTHRMFCLSGDSKLTFDLPSGNKKSEFRCYKMTLKEFYDKWTQGAVKRKRHSYEVSLDKDNIYTAKEISTLTGKSVSNIRSRCRDNTIVVQNPNKKRSEDFLILGSDYNNYHNSYEDKGYDLKLRLSSMKIRQLNEKTGKIQHSTVVDCIYSGVKSVYLLTLENGMNIKCSEDHRILTEDGWKKLKNISTNDFIITQAFGVQDKSNPYIHKKINGKWVSQFIRNIRSEIEKDQNGVCMNCDNLIEDIHHIEPVHLFPKKAFDKSNLVGLCKQCHLNEHSNQNWQVSQYLYGNPIKVQSITYIGKEDTYDLEIAGEYPNFIANDIVVHNSRNSASSRAIPFKKMVEMVEEKPFIPIAWQKDHKGMQGTEYFSDKFPDGFSSERAATDILERRWLQARDFAVTSAKELHKAGSEDEEKVSKQLCNRLLEPFMWHTVIVTATEWNNFFELRCPQYQDPEGNLFKSRKDYANDSQWKGSEEWSLIDWVGCNKSQADIHIQFIAELMWDAYNESTPTILKENEWHIPFNDHLKNVNLKDSIKIATARCARISYQTLGDNPTINFEKDIALHDILAKHKHWSPFEHIAKVMNENEYDSYYRGVGANSNHTGIQNNKGWCRNFKGFIQYRNILEH